MFSNAMWALNLDTAIKAFPSGPAQPWTKIQSDLPDALWAPRAGFSLVKVAGTILLFGGYTCVVIEE